MIPKRHFSRTIDTFIVGGGVTGAASAAALAKSPFFTPDPDA
jgi:glycine/D-amino acid oxidase-like deaminating enzyme